MDYFSSDEEALVAFRIFYGNVVDDFAELNLNLIGKIGRYKVTSEDIVKFYSKAQRLWLNEAKELVKNFLIIRQAHIARRNDLLKKTLKPTEIEVAIQNDKDIGDLLVEAGSLLRRFKGYINDLQLNPDAKGISDPVVSQINVIVGMAFPKEYFDTLFLIEDCENKKSTINLETAKEFAMKAIVNASMGQLKVMWQANKRGGDEYNEFFVQMVEKELDKRGLKIYQKPNGETVIEEKFNS